MKHMKKLMSCLLAVAMVLSLGVSALADEKTDYVTATDELTGTTTNEGAMEVNKISIILPTTTANMYDMKLDPHDLIFRTNAGRYTGKTFDFAADTNNKPTQKLFFLTKATIDSGDTDSKNYTKDSAPLTIVNKGMDDISVTVTVEVDPQGNEFDFVAANALDNSATEAQMYLAVVSGSQTSAVTAPAADAQGVPYEASAKVVSGAYLKNAELTITKESAVTDAINEALGNIVINANYDAADSGKVTFTLAGVNGDLIEVTGIPDAGISGDTDDGLKDVELEINDGNAVFAVVDFQVDTAVTAAIQSGATNAASIQLSGAGVKEPSSQAVLTTTVAGSPTAFKETWDTTNSKYTWTRLPAPESGSAAVAGTTFADADYKTMSFNLTGNINGADAWDELSLTASDAIGITVIWKAESVADAAASGAGSTNAAPTVALKSNPISTAAAVTYTVTYGSGTGERAKVNKIYCTRSGSTNEMTLTFNADKSEVTFTPTGMQFSNGTNWKIEFTAEDGTNATTLDLPSFKA